MRIDLNPDDQGIGFAQFSSPKKNSGGANVYLDGFSQIVNKNKRSRSGNVQDGFAPNSQVIKPTTEKAGYTDQHGQAQFGQRVLIPTQSVQRVSTQSGKHVPTPIQSGHRVPTQSGQRIPTRSRQHIRAHSEKGTGQHVQAHTGQSFPTRYQSRPNEKIHVPSQSQLHSPTQSRKRTSQSGQSTPDESLQLTAQSRQHTPEAQSKQRTRSEPVEHTPTPSHPSTLNVSSTAANGNPCWNFGFEQSDGRVRVEVFDGTLEPSFDFSLRIKKLCMSNLSLLDTIGRSFQEKLKVFILKNSSAWLASARRKYSELVSLAHGKWEYHNKRDDRIGMNVYLSWVEFWKTEDFKTKSSIQKGNHRRGVDGHLSTQTSGSTSHKKVAAHLNIQYKHKPTADQVFFEAHTRHLKKKNNLTGETGENGMDNESDEVETIWIDKKKANKHILVAKLKQDNYGGEVDYFVSPPLHVWW
ncbi:hypothetical protein POM88_038959 [Heracleum sosnowskyi]|uniref:Uncharacterized protein n=1 Tax=Heracleum sosnowskyi TaxID=360622 RepID=A0AAD8HBF0_9APIA|nr:hypothetical protein POM88_038959 [Heracleum sosnowskyi]